MTKEKLEKEAEGWLNKWELCNKCENKVNCISNFSYCKKVVLKSYLASAEPREKQIAELEKENAELKGIKDVATLIRANNDTVVTLMQLNNMLVIKGQQLTKAKEIIKKLLNLPFASDEEVFADVSTILGKAEQFIKYSEVEK